MSLSRAHPAPRRRPHRAPVLRGALLAALALAAGPALATGRALAEEAAAAPAPGRPRLERSDLELLPLHEAQRARFLRDHADLLMRLEILLARADRVEQNLRERERPGGTPDAATLALREELARLGASLEALVPELQARLATVPVPPDALERVRRAPRGPLRAERLAHALVLEAPDLAPAQRRVLAHLVPAVDGALLVLEAEVAAQERRAAERASTPSDAAGIPVETLRQRQKAVQKRFWRVVDAVLTTPQRAAVVQRLPTRLQQRDDAIAHIYLLEGLTPSQGVQVKALLLELEAEAAADTAEAQALTAALAAPGLGDTERRRLERERGAVQSRLVDLQLRAYEQGLALFTPEQVQELRSVPPHLTAADRQVPPQQALAGIPTDAAQRTAFAALAVRYLGAKRELEAGAAEVQRRLRDAGPDSPEREMAEMMAAGLGGRVVRALREVYGEILRDVLTPEQVEGWVLGLYPRPDGG